MPDITVTIPAGLLADITLIMQTDTHTSLTGRELVAEWVKLQLGPRLKAMWVHKNLAAAVAAEVAARTAMEQALATESAARAAAVAAAEADAETALGGIS